MKPEAFNFPLFLILLGICLGIIIQDTWSILPPFVCILLSLGSILFLWACFYLLEKFQKIAIFLCGLFIGALCYNVHNPASRKDHYVQLLIPDKEYTFSGVVEDIKGRQLVVSLAEVEGEKCNGKISLFLKDSLNPTAYAIVSSRLSLLLVIFIILIIRNIYNIREYSGEDTPLTTS